MALFARADGAERRSAAPRPARRSASRRHSSAGCSASNPNSIAQISATIRAAKSDGSAVWTLLAISFAYGIFHAAGPGHGKAVISSYLVANGETARRGIVLSFASALMQSLVAVAIVGIGALLLNATAKTMCGAEKADRDRKLCSDRGVRCPAGLDQGRRIPSCAAGAEAGADTNSGARRRPVAPIMVMTTAISSRPRS